MKFAFSSRTRFLFSRAYAGFAAQPSAARFRRQARWLHKSPIILRIRAEGFVGNVRAICKFAPVHPFLQSRKRN